MDLTKVIYIVVVVVVVVVIIRIHWIKMKIIHNHNDKVKKSPTYTDNIQNRIYGDDCKSQKTEE